MTHGTLLSCIGLFISAQAYTQAPELAWQRCLGGGATDYAMSIIQTPDGGYIAAGQANSVDGDVTNNHGTSDCWVVKLDPAGALDWERCLGGSDLDYAQCIALTSDSGYIMAGTTGSTDGDVSSNHGEGDFWVVKLDSIGNIVWETSLGGSGGDIAHSIAQTTDGGFIVSGQTTSMDGDVTNNNTAQNYWVVKLDDSGGLVWERTLGGDYGEGSAVVFQTSAGGYVVAGWSTSENGDVTNHLGGWDSWVVSLDGDGNLQWELSSGGTGDDYAFSVAEATDGGYLVAGSTTSTDGDVTGNHGGADLWVQKIDVDGNMVWNTAIGGSSYDEGYFIRPDLGGGILVGGWSWSSDGDIATNNGEQDLLLVKLDDQGSLVWEKTLGGTLSEQAFSVAVNDDGAYLVAGITRSNDIDVSNNHGDGDMWVVKLDPFGMGVQERTPVGFDLSPNPARNTVRITCPEQQGQATFILSDALGRKRFAHVVNQPSFDLDLSGLMPGMYELTMFGAFGRASERLIVE